ncbi:phosphotransferase [Formicincola oecophyllae]|uniref:Phosphotransferase n=1 Tax=Formicincola oecophyllae TaxID=2558361 RepID=A0A4Y6U7R8_9PROT|nr:phosphotransferase [Formicincola oecophyllae]QDH13459.1 phosphotransferase [Formicincola oecophyllae]
MATSPPPSQDKPCPAIPMGVDETIQHSDWPALTQAEIKAVLASHGHAHHRQPRILETSIRPYSAAALVTLPHGEELFIKRHDGRLRTAGAQQKEHDFIHHLHSQGLPVIQPLKTPQGQSFISLPSQQGAPQIYELFPGLKGRDTYRHDVTWGQSWHNQAQAYAAGALLGRLHRASATWRTPPQPRSQEALLLSGMAPLEGADGANRFLAAMAQRGLPEQRALLAGDLPGLLHHFHQRLRQAPSQEVFLWGHGDWHGVNLTWRQDDADKIEEVFDFGMSDATSAAFDLAVALERSAIAWLNPGGPAPFSQALLDAFLAGYASTGFSAALKRCASWLPLCHVPFALSEDDYYRRLLQDGASADIALEGYLVGHMQWFLAEEGQRFLSTLQQSAERHAAAARHCPLTPSQKR